SHLGMDAIPFSWPVGMARRFGGVFNIRDNRMRVFRPGQERRQDDDEFIEGLDNPESAQRFGEAYAKAREEIELISEASLPFDHDAFLSGKQTPVFFGSPSTTSACRKCWTRWLSSHRRRARVMRWSAAWSLMSPSSPAWSSRCRPIW